jgi:hypothetical protein
VIASETEPIWLTLRRSALQAFLAMPSAMRFGVGDEQIVADNLGVLAELGGERGVRGPVVLVERVLDRDDGELVDKVLVDLGELLAGDDLGAVVVGAS